MKLRDKLKISFCVMIVLPVIMLCVFVVGIFKMQSDSIAGKRTGRDRTREV